MKLHQGRDGDEEQEELVKEKKSITNWLHFLMSLGGKTQWIKLI